MLSLLLLKVFFVTFSTASYEYYRLPTSVKPQHYDLRVLTHLEDHSQLFFKGDVKIHLKIIQHTRNITLHVGSRLVIATNGTWLKGAADGCNSFVNIEQVERDSKHDYYILHLEQELRPPQRYLLHMSFWGRLGLTMSGYYASSYRDEQGKRRYLSVTQFEPADARAAFPCFDEPHLKASFNISLGHPKNFKALSNMPLAAQLPICDLRNWVWSHFRRTPIMSTYLVAYSINQFQPYISSNQQSSTSFTIWARSTAIEQCHYAAEIGLGLMRIYEELFEIKYPLPKLDNLAVPDFSAGAMENWGLITYRESSLLYSKRSSSVLDKQHVTNIVAHELAHQWFGNLVTMAWWTDLWLNEGFATYMAMVGTQKLCSSWPSYEEESLNNVLTILSADAYCSSRAIHLPVRWVGQLPELFDAITYRKGAVIIRMMHIFLGDDTFFGGINTYLQRHAYGNARQEDLWRALTEAAHTSGTTSIPKDLNMKTIMDSWTLQPGIPLLKVERHYAKGTATVTQQRYLLSEAARPIKLEQLWDFAYCWYIPITYTIASQYDFTAAEPKAWLRCGQQQQTLPVQLEQLPGAEEWIILNMQLATPYRVNYDTINWELIITCLRHGIYQRIHPLNRAQLLDDALALSWSGHLSYSLSLQLLGYLQRERDYLPWRAALEQLEGIERIMRQTKTFSEFQHFMLHLLQPIYTHLGRMQDHRIAEHHVAHITLIQRWACELCLADCVKRALKYFQHWMVSADASHKVPRNLRSVVYCTAMRHGDAQDWQFLWQRYGNTTVASEQRLILISLSCSGDALQLERYLAMVYKTPSVIRRQDATHILGAIIRNDKGFHIARDYILRHFEQLQHFYGGNPRELASLIGQLGQRLSSRRDHLQLRSFIAAHKVQLSNSERSLALALEQAEMNLRWRRQRLPQFLQQLRLIYAD